MTFYERLASDTQVGEIAELYTIVKAGSVYYFTSHNEDVTHGGVTYYSRTIRRGGIKVQFSSIESTVAITAPIDGAFSIFVDAIPVSDVSLTIVMKILATGETQQIFMGKLTQYSISGYKCTASFRNRGGTLLREPVPKMRFQGPCNNALYDANCGLAKSQYKVGGLIVYTTSERSELSSREVVVGDAFTDGFGEVVTDKQDVYFVGGIAYYNGHYRDISGAASYEGGLYLKITLQYAFPDDIQTAGNTLSLWPGCNKLISHCIGRFNNRNHFAGFPYITSVKGMESSC